MTSSSLFKTQFAFVISLSFSENSKGICRNSTAPAEPLCLLIETGFAKFFWSSSSELLEVPLVICASAFRWTVILTSSWQSCDIILTSFSWLLIQLFMNAELRVLGGEVRGKGIRDIKGLSKKHSHTKVTRLIVIPLGVKIGGLVPLRALKSKMTSVKGIIVPFKYERK